MPRALWKPLGGGGLFLMSEVPLYGKLYCFKLMVQGQKLKNLKPAAAASIGRRWTFRYALFLFAHSD